MLTLGKVRWRYTGTLCLIFFLQVENLNFKISNYFKIYFLSARILQTNQAHLRRVTYWVGLPAMRHVQILDKAENSFNCRPYCQRSATAGASIANTALALSRSSAAGRVPALISISSAAMSGGVTDKTGSLLRCHVPPQPPGSLGLFCIFCLSYSSIQEDLMTEIVL